MLAPDPAANLVRKLNIARLLRRVLRRQQIPYEEQEQDEFNRRADWIVLVA